MSPGASLRAVAPSAYQLTLPEPSPLDVAILRACPAADFCTLVERVCAVLPEADVCEADARARALGVEHGDAGRLYYARPA